jgi:hypothetical protein
MAHAAFKIKMNCCWLQLPRDFIRSLTYRLQVGKYESVSVVEVEHKMSAGKNPKMIHPNQIYQELGRLHYEKREKDRIPGYPGVLFDLRPYHKVLIIIKCAEWYFISFLKRFCIKDFHQFRWVVCLPVNLRKRECPGHFPFTSPR